MIPRLVCILALAAFTPACLGLRGLPRFGKLEAKHLPFAFHHDVRVFTAKNGITLALLPDRRTNLVTVDARYLVGAVDDPVGRSGMAHLVEHLTFEAWTGPDRASIGGRLGEATLYSNAFTSHDVTHYTATALASRLSDVIELEAQRLEIRCEQIDEAVFSRERDVVLEEDAERHGSERELQAELSRVTWGAHHPYARDIATREVANATRDEACQFISRYYTPDRLMLVVTGDFDAVQLVRAMGQRFAGVQRRTGTPRASVPEAKLQGTESHHTTDVDEPVAMVFFPAPAQGSKDSTLHDYSVRQLSRVLGRFAEEEDWITGVGVGTAGEGLARLVVVRVSVNDPQRLRDAVFEVVRRAPFIFADVKVHEAMSLLGQLRNDFLASYESFESRGAWIADQLTYKAREGFLTADVEALTKVELEDLQDYARKTFSQKTSHVALIEPSGRPVEAGAQAMAAGRELDLPAWHAPVDREEAQRTLAAPIKRVRQLPEQRTLENGLQVILAPDPTSSLVDVRLVFPYGSASDPPDRRGRAEAAAQLLESPGPRQFLSEHVDLATFGLSLGTQIDRSVYETSTVFSARGSSHQAGWHVWRLLWLVDQCNYLDDSVADYRDRQVRDKPEFEPEQALARQLLYGVGHPYALPPPSGKEWAWLTSSELERYRWAYYVPEGATLIVSGGFRVEAMWKHVQDLFGPWENVTKVLPVHVPAAQPAAGPSWIGTRDPSRTQVELLVAFATVSAQDQDRAARAVLQEMVQERLRIVREGMGASYGVQAAYSAGSGGGVFYVQSELDPARASKAASTILSELESIRTRTGELAEDFVRARRRVLATALADAAGATAVADEFESIVRRGLPMDHFDQLALKVSQVSLADVEAVAAADFDSRRKVVWVTAAPERMTAVMTALGASEPHIFDKKQRDKKLAVKAGE